MPAEAIQPGSAFRSSYVEDDVFIFNHPCSIIEGEGLFRRFNITGRFIEQEWYRFQFGAAHLSRAGEWDFTNG